LKYGPVLTGLVDPSHIKLDMRNSPSKTKADSDYPYIVFRSVTTMENSVQFVRDRVEIEIIGLRSSATTGDDALETIREAIMNYFAWEQKTWGKFNADGTPNPSGGLRLKCIPISKVEGFNQELDEKVHILMFLFNYTRP
jgi:hypothetical protein